MATNANANGIPFLKRTGIPPAIKNSMVVYYDIKKQGCTNESMKANPVLKDFSGNGNDGQCNNFAWNCESGIGEFVFKDFVISNKDNVNIKENIITINISVDIDSIGMDIMYSQAKYDTPATKVKVTGIKNGIKGIYYYRNSEGIENTVEFIKDGIYNFPKSFNTVEGTGTNNALRFYNPDKIETIITIEQLDYYRDAICTDGVDDYIYCYLEGRLTNTTVVFDVNWSIDTKICGIFVSGNMSIYNQDSSNRVFIKNRNIGTYYPKTIIAVSTDNKIYENNLNVITHNIEQEDNFSGQTLALGGKSNNVYTKMYLRRIALFNRVLTADEIKYVYEKIFGCKLKTMEERVEDSIILHYDIAKQGATNESMKSDPRLIDLSGDGYDAKLYNFAWNRMSGVGGYVTNYTDYYLNTGRGSIVATPTKIIIEKVIVAEALIETIKNIGKIPSYRIRVSGIPEGGTLRYAYYQEEGIKSQFDITEDGEYILPANINSYNNVGFKIVSFTGDCNITIEQLPLYPNALVSDGVDDYGLVEGLPLLIKEVGYTVITKRTNLTKYNDNIDKIFLVKGESAVNNVNAVFSIDVSSGPNHLTYINFGEENNGFIDVYTSNLVVMTSKKLNEHDIEKGNITDDENKKIYLFSSDKSACYMSTVFYSLMLFNRDLTTEEIEFVKQKYFSD